MQKILVIHHSGMIGGAGVSLLHILESIDVNNNEIKIYAPNKPNDMFEKIKDMGFEFLKDPYKLEIFKHYSGEESFFISPRSIINLIKISKSIKYIKKIFERERPDIVIVNSMTLFYIGKIAEKYNIRSICFHRESYANGLLGLRTQYLKNVLNQSFDDIVFISEYDKKVTGNGKSKKHVIYDKVKLNEYIEETRGLDLDYRETKYILYMGGMNELKGAHVIIEALKFLNSNIKLIFMQYNGPKRIMTLSDFKTLRGKVRFILKKDYQANVLKIVNDNDLWDRIIFFDKTFDTIPFYNSVSLVVFPSTSPHQARPIYEAGSKKIPVIITASPNISEFVEYNKNGLTFNNENALELAKNIQYLISNDEVRIKLGINNYKLTKKYHDFDDLKLELIKLI